MAAVGAGETRCTVEGDVATLTLDRPAKHNAVSDLMWSQLTEHVHRLGPDEDVRMIVVRGEGDVFSAGADLDDLVAASGDPESARRFCVRVAQALHALATSPQLTVAALRHHVRGGGAEIALACDLRVAEEDVLQIPVSRLGVVPDRFTTRRLLALSGPSVARRVLLLAHELDAGACLRAGLVDEVVATGELDDALDRVAVDLRPTAGSAVRLTKQMLSEDEGLTQDPEEVIAGFTASLLGGDVAERGPRALRRDRT